MAVIARTTSESSDVSGCNTSGLAVCEATSTTPAQAMPQRSKTVWRDHSEDVGDTETPTFISFSTPQAQGCTAGGKSAGTVVAKFLRDVCRAYTYRVHATYLLHLDLFQWETELLIDELGFGPRMARVLSWRRSVLEVGSVFYLLVLTFRIADLVRAATGDYENFVKGKALGIELGDYKEHFKWYIVMQYCYHIGVVTGEFTAWILNINAIRHWKDMWLSFTFSRRAFLLSYFIPFVLFALLPFRLGVDMQGIQRHLCKDLIDGVGESIENWAPYKLFQRSGMNFEFSPQYVNHMSYGGLRPFLLTTYAINLPENTCDYTMHDLDMLVATIVRDSGRLSPAPGELCPYAVDASTMVNASVAIASVAEYGREQISAAIAPSTCSTPPCRICGGSTCLAVIPLLTSAMTASLAYASQTGSATHRGVSRHDAVSRGVDANLDAMGFNTSTFRNCTVCLKPLAAHVVPQDHQDPVTCASLCLPFWASQARAGGAFVPHDEAQPHPVDFIRAAEAFLEADKVSRFVRNTTEQASMITLCIDASELASLQALLRIMASTEHWEVLLGMWQSTRVLSVLLPVTFAMLFGASKGALVVKGLAPGSRIPGLLLACAVIFSTPFLALAMITLTSAVGDWILCLGLFCALLTLMVFLPIERAIGIMHTKSIMDPMQEEELKERLDARQNYAYLLYVVTFLLLIIWIFSSDYFHKLAQLAWVQVDLQDVHFTFTDPQLWKFFGWHGTVWVCSLYGASKISKIFFADAELFALLWVDEANVSHVDLRFLEANKNLYEEFEHALKWRITPSNDVEQFVEQEEQKPLSTMASQGDAKTDRVVDIDSGEAAELMTNPTGALTVDSSSVPSNILVPQALQSRCSDGKRFVADEHALPQEVVCQDNTDLSELHTPTSYT